MVRRDLMFAWLDQIPELGDRIRTVHLIGYQQGKYVVLAHTGRQDITDFYGTEERVHEYLTIAPALILGTSGTVEDIVGKPELITVRYEKAIVAYVPVAENIIAVSLTRDAHPHFVDTARKIWDFVPAG